MYYITVFFRIIRFLPYYIRLVITSNKQVIRDVITVKKYAEPAIIKVPLTVTKEFEFFLLANLISMTPGTVSLDISKNRKNLFVHVMFFDEDDDGEEVRNDIKQLQERVARIFK
jgi:multicomponent Na+:H+ antiporter subunit E